MRAPMMTFFHETVELCFKNALEGMGSTVRDVIYDHLERHRIPRLEIPGMFDEVVRVLTESFGSSAWIIIYKTVVDLYGEYSVRADFTYQDSLRDRFILLKDRVVADHLLPRHAQRLALEAERVNQTFIRNPSSPIVKTQR